MAKKTKGTTKPKPKTAVKAKSTTKVQKAVDYKSLQVENAISYLCLLSFCPPRLVNLLNKSSFHMHSIPASGKRANAIKAFSPIAEDACRRIVAFQQNKRTPNARRVKELHEAVLNAVKYKKYLSDFQELMAKTTALPGRKKPENRLVENKGCQLCEKPCRYGYFLVVSEPDFNFLDLLLKQELAKEKGEQSLLNATWTFTTSHLWKTVGSGKSFVTPEHMGNLAFCLMVLGMAKSRKPYPEKEMAAYQKANQELIAYWNGRTKM